MSQNRVLDVIINLLMGVKNGKSLRESFNGEIVEISNCAYLLNQVIRQYSIPTSHFFISKKAFELWAKIRNDCIFNYTYRDKVVKNTRDIVSIDKYKGSEKEPYSKDHNLLFGESFIFNDVFTDEHIVPINIIIKELLSLDTYDYLSVKKVLDKIYICKLLKEEDYIIKNRSNRSSDYREVILSDYYDVGIRIKDFDNIKAAEELLITAQQELEKCQKTV